MTANQYSLPPEVLLNILIVGLRFEQLVTQMKWRLREGNGEALYELGVEDQGLFIGLSLNDLQKSKLTLKKMADRLGATLQILREKQITNLKYICEILVRKVLDEQPFIDIRIAVLGSHDSGKSTLLGVLTRGGLDDGHGSARLDLFRHFHEIESGRTSSISIDILGFDSKGKAGPDGKFLPRAFGAIRSKMKKLINYEENRTVEEIYETSSKLLTFLDLAGFYKYQKTTLFGLSNYSPDYVMLVIDGVNGLAGGTSREHLGLALALNLPVFIVYTKIDIVDLPFESLNATTTSSSFSNFDVCIKSNPKFLEILESLENLKKVPFFVHTRDQVYTAAHNVAVRNVVPIIAISCLTGRNLPLLKYFLQLLPPVSPSSSNSIFITNNTDPCYPPKSLSSTTINTFNPGGLPDPHMLVSITNVEETFTISNNLSSKSELNGHQLDHDHDDTPFKKRKARFENGIVEESLILHDNDYNELNDGQISMRQQPTNLEELSEFLIDEVFTVEGVRGFVVSGIMDCGVIQEGQTVNVGPFETDSEASSFLTYKVASIRRCNLIRRILRKGECATLAIVSVHKQHRKDFEEEPGTFHISDHQTLPPRAGHVVNYNNNVDQLGVSASSSTTCCSLFADEESFSSNSATSNDAATILPPLLPTILPPPIRKGMVLLHKDIRPTKGRCQRFQAQIFVMYHATSLSAGFQTYLFVRNVRQSAIIESIDHIDDTHHNNKKNLKTGQSGIVTLRFLQRPEYLKVGLRLILREASLRGIGQITRIFDYEPELTGSE